MVVPQGPISEPIQTLINLCINSQAFINRCTLGGVAPADQIYITADRPDLLGDVVNPPALTRPFLIVIMRDFEFVEFDEQCMQPTNSILGLQAQDDQRQPTWQENIKDFNNFWGLLLEDISKRTMTNESLVIRNIKQTQAPMPVERRHEQSTHDFIFAEADIVVGADF